MDNSLILNRIKDLKKFTSDVELASYLGIRSNVLSNWKTRNSIDFETIFTVCERDGISLDWLITGKSTHINQDNAYVYTDHSRDTEIKQVRPIIEINPDIPGRPNTIVLDVKAAAGFGALMENPKQLESLPAIYVPNAPKGLNIRIPIFGDSMHPTIKNADEVDANHITDVKDIREGFVYIIFDRYDGILCKRVYLHGKDFHFVSDNRIFSPYTKPSQDIIAVFKAFGHYSHDFRPYHDDTRKRVEILESDMLAVKNRLGISDFLNPLSKK